MEASTRLLQISTTTKNLTRPVCVPDLNDEVSIPIDLSAAKASNGGKMVLLENYATSTAAIDVDSNLTWRVEARWSKSGSGQRALDSGCT